jgi:hypothetical protein
MPGVVSGKTNAACIMVGTCRNSSPSIAPGVAGTSRYLRNHRSQSTTISSGADRAPGFVTCSRTRCPSGATANDSIVALLAARLVQNLGSVGRPPAGPCTVRSFGTRTLGSPPTGSARYKLGGPSQSVENTSVVPSDRTEQYRGARTSREGSPHEPLRRQSVCPQTSG